MGKVFEGQLSASGLRFGVVVSRFNSFITERLLGGAMDALLRTGAAAVSYTHLDVYKRQLRRP